jgi:LEA14-like dessication related protein
MNGRTGLLLVVLTVTAGCATYVPRAEEVRDVRIELVDLKPEKASLAGIQWEAALRVTNPNPFDLRIEFLEAAIEVGGGPFGSGSAKGFTVKKYDRKDVQLDLVTSSFGMASAVLGMAQSKNFTYSVSADVTYQTKEGPHPKHLEERGSFHR